MRHRIVVWMIGLSLSLGAIPAYGQTKDPAAADALFRQAREAMKTGDYAAACPKLAESQRLDPAPGTVLNLAQCEEKIGKYASSHQHYREAAEQIPPEDPRSKVARDGLAATRERVPRLTVRSPAAGPPGTRVFRDDVELGAASLGTPLPVDPGDHVILTKAPGRKDHKDTISLAAAESKEFTAVIGEAWAEPGEGKATQPPQAASVQSSNRASDLTKESSRGMQWTLGIVTGAVGVVAVGLGGYFAYQASSKKNDLTSRGCDLGSKTCVVGVPNGFQTQDQLDSEISASQAAATRATVAFIAGGALLVGGVVLVLTAPAPANPTQVKVGTFAGPGIAGIRLGGSW